MAFDGITVASLVRELNASLAALRPEKGAAVGKCLPAPALSDGSVKAQPDDCAELLHASQKAYRIRPYSVCNTTFPGADCAF